MVLDAQALGTREELREQLVGSSRRVMIAGRCAAVPTVLFRAAAHGQLDFLTQDHELAAELGRAPSQARALRAMPLRDGALDRRSVPQAGLLCLGAEIEAGQRAREIGEKAREVVLDERVVDVMRARRRGV